MKKHIWLLLYAVLWLVSCGDPQNDSPVAGQKAPCLDQVNAPEAGREFCKPFNHQAISLADSCAQCHDAMLASGKPANHIPTSDHCPACHLLQDWVTPVSTVPDHYEILAGCVQCHYLDSNGWHKPDTHIASSDVCEACHVATGLGMVYSLDHDQLLHIDDCLACHRQTPSWHVVTQEPCSVCHSTRQWLPTLYDHSGVVGMLCFDCHNSVNATGKKPAHPATSFLCEYCHSAGSGWGVTAQMMNHSHTSASCSSCHDGKKISGKQPSHISTPLECDQCHRQTESWQQATLFSHDKVSTTCVLCHNNFTLPGKPESHVQSDDVCEDCHFLPSWNNVDPHGGTSACVWCHDGSYQPGKVASHVASSDQCQICHGVTAWKPLSLPLHAPFTQACADCHDHNGARGMGGTHIPVAAAASCDVCHLTQGWTPYRVDHLLGVRMEGGCDACHNQLHATGKPDGHVPTLSDCGSCHQISGWKNLLYPVGIL